MPELNTLVPDYFRLCDLLSVLRELTSLASLAREAEIFRIAATSARILGPVYDIPTVPGWALMQKAARTQIFISSLLGSTRTSYRVPRSLSLFDDIRPDLCALPEVSPYTEFAAVLYEAVDSLLITTDSHADVHLRNLYPHSVWSWGIVISQSQLRRLAFVAPAPRVFSRVLETPIVGQVLAVPGIVRRPGWITFFEALIPSYVSGGPKFTDPYYSRFMPRSSINQTAATASLLLHDLTFPELYYLILLEKFASQNEMRTTYHSGNGVVDHGPALVDTEFMDKLPFCQAMGVHVKNETLLDISPLDKLASASWNSCRDLAYAEQIMGKAASSSEIKDGPNDEVEVEFVYKRDARWDVATLDDFDGWSDEELEIKGHKTWSRFTPRILMPVEIAAVFSQRGYRVQVGKGGLHIADLNYTDSNPDFDVLRDVFLPDVVTWSRLRSVLASCLPDFPHAADRLLLALVSAGQIYLHGYFHCIDISEFRHMARTNAVFMDQPLLVLGYRMKERDITNRNYSGHCLLVPVGPACTILMRHLSEKYSKIHGRVYHSEDVKILPYGCRLGDRTQLEWFQVGAGPWEACEERPAALTELLEIQLQGLRCSCTTERDNLVVQANKGVSSLRLRDITVEAGFSSWAPHVIISGKGKRITTSVVTYSFTQLVNVLRHLRDSKSGKVILQFSIQEVAAMIVFKEVTTGPLMLTRTGKLGWAPRWKLESKGFDVAHTICLPRGIGVQVINGNRVGLLLTRDTMVVVSMLHQASDIWDVEFRELNGSIESEKLLVGPGYAGFQWRLCGGKMALGESPGAGSSQASY